MSPRRDPRSVEATRVICCRGCGRPLGFSDQTTLYVGSIFLNKRQPLPCQGCGAVTVWEPVEEVRYATTG